MAASSSTQPSGPLRIPSYPEGCRIGAHTSISGGVGLAIGRAANLGFSAAQIFVKNNKQWFAPAPLAPDEAKSFRQDRAKAGLYVFAHNSYLINLGSSKSEIYDTSIKALIAELERCEMLDIPFLVAHPGSHGGAGESVGLKQIVAGLREVIQATPKVKTKIALENTAGQGSSLGHEWKHLAYLLEKTGKPERLGVCLDTAHMFEAGHDIRTRAAYEKTMTEFEKEVGRKWVLGFHLNDSKTGLGSRVDRHEHLGKGEIGWEAFSLVMNDLRWKAVPKVLETPKGDDMREDVENLTALRSRLKE